MQTVIQVPILTELTPQQVLLIKALESVGMFEIKEGSVTVNISGGQIQKIEKKEFYRI